VGVTTPKYKTAMATGVMTAFIAEANRCQTRFGACSTAGSRNERSSSAAEIAMAHSRTGCRCRSGNSAMAANTMAKTNPNCRSEDFMVFRGLPPLIPYNTIARVQRKPVEPDRAHTLA